MHTVDIPRGFCQCGCGKRTALPQQSNTRDGWVKGQPLAYVVGHGGRPPAERFWANVDKKAPTECWEWTGSRTEREYGRLSIGNRDVPAHRL